MNIPSEKLAEIIERADLVAVVSRSLPLKKRGRDYVACCPFHSEKTPSFHVTPGKNVFYCFGCHVGGDAIAFLRKLHGKSFVEAVEELAREVGVSIAWADDPGSREREALRRANEFAARHFGERLWDERRGRPGREHLEKRGVTVETARRFGLGWAMADWSDLATACAKEGILEFTVRAGLCAPRKSSDGFYDVFKGRLMVPIRSPEGRVIAFGGRHVQNMPGDTGEVGAKYLNSKESRLYVKSEVLYGLDLARDAIRSRKQAILVEGYFDAIGLQQAGVANAVALCSTALTAQHLKLLSRLDAAELVLLFDADEAGLRAVERLAGSILASGATARVAVLPAGQDPDEFALARGGAAVEELVAKAKPLTTHLLDRALPSGRSGRWEDKIRAVRALKPVLESMPAGMEKTLFLVQVSEHLGVAESEVKAHLATAPRGAAPSPLGPAQTPAAQSLARGRVELLEELLCALVVSEPALASAPEAEVLDQMSHLGLRSVASAGAAAGEVLAAAPEALRERVERKAAEVRATMGEPGAKQEAFLRASRDLLMARVEERIAAVSAEMDTHEDLTDEAVPLHEELRELTLERQRLAGLYRAAGARPGTRA